MPCQHRFCVTIEYEGGASIHKVLKPIRANETVCVSVSVDFKYHKKPAKSVVFHRNDGKYVSVEAPTHCIEPTCVCTCAKCFIPISCFDD